MSFLSDRGLRTRLAEVVSYKAVLKQMLQSWSINTGFNWKWEYMGNFLNAILPLYQLLVDNYDATAFRGSKEWSEVHATIITTFGSALQFQQLYGADSCTRMVDGCLEFDTSRQLKQSTVYHV